MKLTDSLYMYPEFGMLDSNTYLIKDDINIIIDVGSRQLFKNVVREMHKDGFEPGDIGLVLNTHLHLDHYGADEDFKKLSRAKILFHPSQREHYAESVVQTAQFFGMAVEHVKEDGLLGEKEFTKSRLEIEVITSTGHSADSVCFYSRKEKFLVCGDVIFAGNIGRVDLPGGNADQLAASIKSLSTLDVDLLCPGHMDYVSGKEKVKQNFDYIKESVLRWI